MANKNGLFLMILLESLRIADEDEPNRIPDETKKLENYFKEKNYVSYGVHKNISSKEIEGLLQGFMNDERNLPRVCYISTTRHKDDLFRAGTVEF